MINRFLVLSIRSKLFAIAIVSVLFALLVVAVILMTIRVNEVKQNTQTDLEQLVRLIANRSMAAIMFDDQTLAQENLEILKDRTGLQNACIYTKDSVMARLEIAGVCTLEKSDSGIEFRGTIASVFSPIIVDDNAIGGVLIKLDMHTALLRELSIIAGLVLVVIVAFVISFFWTAPLFNLVSQPIIDLANTASCIAHGEDYSLRANKHTHDEIGVLVDAFNSMLEKVDIKNNALIMAKEDFQNLYDDNPTLIFNINVSGKIISVNRFGAHLLGMVTHEIEDGSFFDFVLADDLNLTQLFLANCQRFPEQVHKQESRIVSHDGKILHVRNTARLVIRESGNQILLVCEDITEQKRIQDRYESLFNEINEGFCIIEVIFDDALLPVDYRYLEVNPTFDRLTGLLDVTGKTMRELCPNHEQYWFDIYGKVALTGQAIHFENHAAELDRWYDVSAYKTGDQHQRRVAILFSDISQRKKIELSLNQYRNQLEDMVAERTEELAEANQRIKMNEERLEYALDATNDGLWDWNLENDQVYYSPAYFKMLGYQPDELNDQTTHLWVELMHPEDRQRTISIANHALINQGSYDIEFRMRTKVGEYKWIQSRGKTVSWNEDGKPVRAVGTHMDLTLRKQYELQLLESKNMAEAVAKAKSLFLATMSHEIRTPMNAVIGFCKLLQKRELNNESRYLAKQIYTASHSLLNIINDILDFSKIEAGRLEIEQEPFRLSDLLEQVAALMIACADKKNLELVIVPALEVDALIGDKHRIQQVLVNLISNAIKFTEWGLVELRIQVVGKTDDAYSVKFLVRDTGIGISEDKQMEIFSAFTQADVSISRRFGGTGLGLAISNQLVALMGGKLEVKSQQNQGSEFSFDLRLKQSKDLPWVPQQSKPIELLIVVDSVAVREAITNIGNNCGWTVNAVQSANDASLGVLECYQNQSVYDVLLLDWDMLRQEGIQTDRLISDLFTSLACQCQKPKILIVGANHREQLLSERYASAFDAILTKPITPLSFYKTVMDLTGDEKPPQLPEKSELKPIGDQCLQNVRILVVDDNEFNLEVAQLQLEDFGAIVNRAMDGQNALAWLAAHPEEVDLILMDINMPVMDGYRATRLIRQNPRWANLPIIASSAGILMDERIQAFEAGMDDFVDKPFDIDYLITSIQRLTGRRSGAEHIVEPQPLRENGQLAPGGVDTELMLPGLAVAEGLKQWRDEAVYRVYLHRFVEIYSDIGKQFIDLITSHDYVAAADLAHKLKGVAGNLALKSIVTQVTRLESLIKAGNVIDSDIDALQAAVAEACSSIERWSGNSVMDTVSEWAYDGLQLNDTQALRLQLEAFLNVLEQNNPAVAEPLLLAMYGILPQAQINQLKTPLELFDFHTARALAQSMLDSLPTSLNAN